MVLFPLESGKFKLSQLVVGGTYEVHGNSFSGPPDAAMPSSLSQNSISTPYGVPTNPTFLPSPPPPHPPRSSKTCGKLRKLL